MRIAVAISGLGGCPAFAREHVISPIQHFGKPTAIRIIASPPEGWQDWGEGEETIVGFVLRGTPTPPPHVGVQPAVQLLVTGEVVSDLTGPRERLGDPKDSLTATWMQSGTRIKEFKKVESFDGGPYGTLPLWLIRGAAYSYYLVIVQREGVLVEVSLRSEAGVSKLKEYAPDLKRLVRSIRIVRTSKN